MKNKFRVRLTHWEDYKYNVQLIVCTDCGDFYTGNGRFCKDKQEVRDYIEKNKESEQ